MADTTVEYILKLQDQMSGTLSRIEANTKHMNSTMEHAKSVVHELKSAFFELFAIEKVFEFLKDSFDDFQKDILATANLNTGIKNLHGTLGITSEALKAQREELSRHSLASQTVIKESQAMLTTFQSVHGDIFKNAIPAIANLSAKMGIDMVDATKSVGFALDNPAEGLMRLRRQGVMFTDSQKILIQNLDATGHHAQAQAEILKLLESRFGGAAQAAANAKPWTVFKSQVTEAMVKVGDSISKIGMGFMPALSRMIDAIDPFVNKLTAIVEKLLPPILNLLHPIASIFKSLIPIVDAIMTPIINSLKPALEAIKIVIELIGKNLREHQSFFTKIGAIIGNILGGAIELAAWIVTITVKFADWLVHTKIFKAVWDSILWVIEKALKAISWIVDKIKALMGIKDITVTNPITEASATEGGGGTDTSAAGAANAPGSVLESKPKEAKATNIYITIGDLVRELNIHSQTLAMSEGQIKEFIVKTFLGAVNGFNLIPGQ